VGGKKKSGRGKKPRLFLRYTHGRKKKPDPRAERGGKALVKREGGVTKGTFRHREKKKVRLFRQGSTTGRGG